MSKEDKRENIIMVSFRLGFHEFELISTQVASEPLTFEKGKHIYPSTPTA